jgi:hypothetical protein
MATDDFEGIQDEKPLHPMNDDQRIYLEHLTAEAGEPQADDDLSEEAADKLIHELEAQGEDDDDTTRKQDTDDITLGDDDRSAAV